MSTAKEKVGKQVRKNLPTLSKAELAALEAQGEYFTALTAVFGRGATTPPRATALQLSKLYAWRYYAVGARDDVAGYGPTEYRKLALGTYDALIKGIEALLASMKGGDSLAKNTDTARKQLSRYRTLNAQLQKAIS